ncbi:Zn-ribbon domain-containing OB-fold protein [Microbacterium rhizomatis]|uniref:Zn-ribbon domain-containing OB-fold protein n=1 Tax=Microbacterium rhizomatis TaxID=1631477 RepID=A0A5J5J3S6_9MICO|nr:Zn-ribbon domain-containing OB-fold protein [Microbacterium rhizomatis]KAA9108199.1 Zn-ribbon domain-containing OB-fold protein [Microbacterium rhizomatis]
MKPVALPTPDTREWFDRIDLGRLTVPRCRDCGSFFLYPRSSCPRCGGRSIELVDAAGTATLLSFVVNQRGPEGFEPPYALAIVQLAEGPRMLAGIATTDPAELEIDVPLRAVFEERGDRKVLYFEPEVAQK